MTKLHKHYIIGLSLLLACSATAAPDLSNFNHGVVYDAMRDLHEERTQDMHEYDSVRCTPPVAWPSVVHPFNFSPETFTSLPDANPAEGVELLSMPYSNSQGDLLLSYDLFLPAAHHDLKAILPVSYNSGRKNGNIAAGWNLDIPQIEMDTLSHGNVNGYESFMLNGRRIVYSGRVQGDTAMVYYYQFHHTTETILRIQTGSGFENCRWELKDGKGVTYRFGSYDKDGKLKDVVRSSLGRVLAWRLCAMENDHKDYVRYRYGEKISDDDSIFVGNPNQDPHTCIVLCGVAQLRKWQDETLSQKMLNKIFVLQAKEFPKGDEKWAHVHDYEFARYKGNLVSIASWGYRQKNGQAIKEDAYHHRFDYYDDVERVAQSRRFRNLQHNISLDSLIVDRTGLLKTAHTPLGGCFTVNYAYSAVPDTLGRKGNAAPKIYTNAAPYLYSRAQFIQKVQDSIQASDAYKTSMILRTADLLDSLFREGVEIASIPFDTLVQWYFDYTDCHKGKRVVTSLWVNDGINSDGEPSRNDYLYERPFCDSLGHFRGFGKVTTLHYNTVTNSCERQRVKHYDTTEVALLGQIRSCELRNNVGDELLQQTEYEWNLDGTPFDSIYCIRLKNRAVSIGDYTYTFAYQYEGGNLSKVLYGNGESLSYSYVKKDENHILPKGMVAEGEGYRFSYALEYEANPPYRLTQITEGENETTFAYDKDGNISEIKFPADGNGESEVCTYRYDRRFNMFLDRVENNLGYHTELEDYNYPYGKPSTLIDQNRFVMRQSFDGYGRLDTLVAPNEIDNKIPYSIVIDHRFIQNFRKEEEIIEGPLFEDSLRLHIPPFVRNGEIEEDVKTKIDSLLATFVLPRRGAKGHIEISISDTVTTPRTICTTSSFGEEDTLFIVGYDTIQLDTCRCHDRYTPASAATLRYNALYNQWNDRKAKDSTIVVYTFIDGFGKKTQRIRKTELTDVDVNNGKFNGKSARWVTTEAKRHDPFGRTTALYPPQLHQGNLGTIGDMDKNIYIVPADTLLSYDGLDRLSSMTIGNHDFSYDYRSDANDGFIRTRVEKYDETRRDTLDIIAYNYRNQLLRKEVMNANARRSDWNVLYFIDRERYAYNLIGKITHSLTAYDKVDYAYDKAGRLISESSARHGNSTFTYDKAGNLIQEKKADGETIQYSYRNNLLSGIAYTLHPENNVSFFYGD
ncbi:MAG: RHS repeat protein, partial [Paludibacteraceae bacterium]|nr:RHS repeat protein [Paludibacteraceae bacterium]